MTKNDNRVKCFDIHWLIIFAMPLIYWLYSFNYNGPAYLADEIGYLSNAIFFSGYLVDGASSYHSGYSFLLAPLFIIFSNTKSIWQGAMLINALLWGGALYLLDRIIIYWRLNMTQAERVLVLLSVGLYPAWVTMAGYVFPSTAFVALFLAGIVTLISIKKVGDKKIYFYTILVGLLYWIHPIGLAVSFASIIVVLIWAVKDRNWRFIVFHLIGIVVLIFVYKYVIQPWLVDAMTPRGFRPNLHYPGILTVLSRMGQLDFWIEVGIKMVGQFSYLIVGTYGLALIGIITLLANLKRLLACKRPEWCDAVGAYMCLSVFGVIAIGAVSLYHISRVDHWIYGRYLDCVSMPVIAVGMLYFYKLQWRTRFMMAAIAVVIIVGSGFLIDFKYFSTHQNNLLNTPSFWPQYIFPKVNIIKWMIVGAIVTAVVLVGGKYLALFAILIYFVLSSTQQYKWHKQILSGYSKPSSIVDIVRNNYRPGTCIGFDEKSLVGLDTFRQERFALYKYYFYDYRYKRIKVDEWQKKCDGPLLTYNPKQVSDYESEKVIARENSSGLFLVVKDLQKEIRIPSCVRSRNDISIAAIPNDPCFLAGCFEINADDLARYTQVGVIRDDQIFSTGRSGYLFYGPYRLLDQGNYHLILRGNFLNTDTAKIDVVSDIGRKIYKEKILKVSKLRGKIIIPFELRERVTDLEIRIFVGNADQLSIEGYDILEAED